MMSVDKTSTSKTKQVGNTGLTNSHTKIINLSNEQVLNEMTQHFVFESVPGYSPMMTGNK